MAETAGGDNDHRIRFGRLAKTRQSAEENL